jgi:hypothetical protein
MPENFRGIGSIFGPSLNPSSCIELGIPSREELINIYCNRRNPVLNYDLLISNIYYYVGFYCWKNAIITQGVAARFVKGQASSGQAEMIGALTPVFGDLSLFMLKQYATMNPKKKSKL